MKFKFLGLKAPDWKKVRVLGILLVAGLLLLTLRLPGGGSGGSGGSGAGARPVAAPPRTAAASKVGAAPPASSDPVAAQQAQIERSLTRILDRIAGAGTVYVAVSLAGGQERRFATDTTTSRTTTAGGAASTGGSTTTQDSVRQQVVLVHSGTAGADAPVTAQVLRPQVRGVLVVATGATSALVRAEIAQAVAAAAGVPIYRVVVLPARSAGVTGKTGGGLSG